MRSLMRSLFHNNGHNKKHNKEGNVNNKNNTLLYKLIYTEIPEGFTHKWVRPVSIIWGVATAALLYGLLFLFGSLEEFETFYYFLDTPEKEPLLYLLFLVTFLGVAFRAYFAVASITQHDEHVGIVLEDRYVTFVISSVIMQNILMGVVTLFVGLSLFTLGYSAFGAFELTFISEFFQRVVDGVPTLVQLSYWPALIVTYLVITLSEYGWHRMGHESRLLWLLSHRPHHISTTLCSATVVEADPAFPLGLLWKAIAIALIGSVVAKLFHDGNVFFVELAILRIGWGISEIFNHTSAFYDRILKNRWVYPIMTFFGSGPYHVLHHSSLPEHTVANLGGGVFLLWDRVFGTYFKPTEKIPPLGLTNQPDIYLNPLNMALSGLLQVVYELKNNKGFVVRFKILFGGVFYAPPISKSFIKKPLLPEKEVGVDTDFVSDSIDISMIESANKMTIVEPS